MPLWNESPPPLGDIHCRPFLHDIRPVPHDDVPVLAHDREGQNVDAKHARKKLQPRLNPLASMVIRVPADRVRPTQKHPPHAPLYHAINADIVRIPPRGVLAMYYLNFSRPIITFHPPALINQTATNAYC